MSKRMGWTEVAAAAFTTISVASACVVSVVVLMYPVFQVLGAASP